MTRTVIYFLYPVSLLYAFIVSLRNMFFHIRLFKAKGLPVPVISVGNVTMGGTGKTPVVAYISRLLQDSGYRVGILSRGYKRNSHGYVVVSDGETVLVDAERGGDEPVMLAQNLPGAVVAVDEQRYRGGMFLVKKYNPDVIILDDGFQHRWVHRELDIVLINASRREQMRAFPPVGRLRESLSALRRADIIIITKYTDDEDLLKTESFVQRYTDGPVLGSKIEASSYIDVINNSVRPIETICGKKAFLFSGIAETENFRKTAEVSGVEICGTRWFRDHYMFKREDIDGLLQEAKENGADIFLTTEKDAVRLSALKELIVQDTPLYALRILFSVNGKDEGVLRRYIHNTMNRYKN
jgi:tetraacyldisaccharide 4'-kinase